MPNNLTINPANDDKIQWKDDDITNLSEFNNQNGLKITKPSFKNLRNNLTSGFNALNEFRKKIPEPPEQLEEGLDWAYHNHPVGWLDRGVDKLASDVSNLITNKTGSPEFGTAVALGIMLASPSGLGKVKSIEGLNEAFKISKRFTKKGPNIKNLFPPNQTLQPQFAGNSGLTINPNKSIDLAPQSMMIKGDGSWAGRGQPPKNKTANKLWRLEGEVKDSITAEELGYTPKTIEIGKKTGKGSNILSHEKISKKDWMDDARKWYKKHFGTRPDPMRGYPHWRDNTGEVYRATPGSRNKKNPEGLRPLTATSLSARGKMSQTRKINEDKWIQELKTVLEEFGIPDEFEKYSKLIKSQNRAQSKEITRLNKILKIKGVVDIGKHLTIDHGGSVKQGWPNLPENRNPFGMTTITENARTKELGDLPGFNLRMSNISKTVREWVIKQKIQEDFGMDANVLSNLPLSIRRKIANAKPIKDSKGKIISTVDDVINDTLESYFKKSKKVEPQWEGIAKIAMRQMKEGNLPEARWRNANTQFTWAPKDLGGKGRGYIDIIKDATADDDVFALKRQFFKQIEDLPSGTEWTLEADTAQKYRLYKRMFRGDPRFTPGGDTKLLKARGIDHFILRIP